MGERKEMSVIVSSVPREIVVLTEREELVVCLE